MRTRHRRPLSFLILLVATALVASAAKGLAGKLSPPK